VWGRLDAFQHLSGTSSAGGFRCDGRQGHIVRTGADRLEIDLIWEFSRYDHVLEPATVYHYQNSSNAANVEKASRILVCGPTLRPVPAERCRSSLPLRGPL